MIPQDTVNLILDTARIEEVVGDFLTLKRRGAGYVACCPFHNEKTPSFTVTPAKGIYHCFGCHKGGTAVGFVMEHEHLTYVEALKYLARKYHIEVVEKEESAEDIAARQRTESLLLVTEFAQKFFSDALATPEGRSVAMAYYNRRGIEEATIRKFGLGWSPSGRRAFVDAALAAGYKEEYLVDANLATRTQDGHLIDRFSERVMFPIWSVSGRVIAFSGRTLKSEAEVRAKYVNSSETEIYVKSRTLYGMYQAKSEISKLDKCILVEGNVDVVMMNQLGITNVVASCGTALTVEQIRLIRKFTENVTIMYDGDKAGIKAALRGISLVLTEGLNVKIVLLPDGDDPDSYSRKHTLQEVQDFIAGAERDFVDFKADLLSEEAGNDPIKKAGLINDLADTVACIPDAVKRSVYVERLSGRFNIDAQILFDRIARDRKEIIEAQRREKARLDRYQENGLDIPPEVPLSAQEEYGSVPAYPSVGRSDEEDRITAAAERDLLTFILQDGCTTLEFQDDSPFYLGSEDEKYQVAEFIRDALSEDGGHFHNEVYRKVYDEYMSRYAQGFSQDRIIMDMLNSEDRKLSEVVTALSTEKYCLSVNSFEASMMTKASKLVQYVPKAVIKYNERLLESRIDKIRKQINGMDPEQQIEAMQEMSELLKLQNELKKEYGKKL